MLWECDGDRIDEPSALAALEPATRQLERALYRSRWDQAPPGEQRYMATAADLMERGEVVTGRAVADHLGTTTRSLSAVRDRLIKKGTLAADGRRLRFAVPGMADYVRRRRSEE